MRWTFGPSVEDESEYQDGTIVPSRHWKVYQDGKVVGEVEVHMHKRGGKDKVPDFSAGITVIVYGPSPGGS